MNKFFSRITGVDIFAGVNILLFLWMCGEVYYDRFVFYRGYDHLQEFFVYALVILAVITTAWRLFRHISVSAWILAMVQVGIVMHFAGGLALWQDTRLYNAVLFGIRYDKYVHFVNSFICAWALYFLCFRTSSFARWLSEVQLVIGVLGLGAVVEVVEYLVTLTVVSNGVGGYDNNMQDMIANLSGSICCVFVLRIWDMARDKLNVSPSLTDVRASVVER